MPNSGRQSQEDLTVAAVSLPKRPKPPKGLSKEEAVVWNLVVNRMPADWVR